MGLFGKRDEDPISRRLRELDLQIHDLEKQLSHVAEDTIRTAREAQEKQTDSDSSQKEPKGVRPQQVDPRELDFFASKPGNSENPPAKAKQPVQEPKKPVAQKQPFSSQHDVRLASYLTTGSFQSLKPLKYERRMMRNRVIIGSIILLVTAFLVIYYIRQFLD